MNSASPGRRLNSPPRPRSARTPSQASLAPPRSPPPGSPPLSLPHAPPLPARQRLARLLVPRLDPEAQVAPEQFRPFFLHNGEARRGRLAVAQAPAAVEVERPAQRLPRLRVAGAQPGGDGVAADQ